MICHCGKKYWALAYPVDSGKIKSCGCLSKELWRKANTTHGMKKTRQYNTWKNIKQRCDNKNHTTYRYYGGKGITYCKSWSKFENFWRDMKDGYSDNLTIDRIDNNGNYCKENCRWVTMKEQSVNKSNNI